MKDISSKKNGVFATVALMCTLGCTIAGFIWLHVEAPADETQSVAMSHEDKLRVLDIQLDHQQTRLNELQIRVERLENLGANGQIKPYVPVNITEPIK